MICLRPSPYFTRRAATLERTLLIAHIGHAVGELRAVNDDFSTSEGLSEYRLPPSTVPTLGSGINGRPPEGTSGCGITGIIRLRMDGNAETD